MPWIQQRPGDEPSTVGLDAVWRGLNDALDPSLLDEGYYAKGINVRIGPSGKPITRGVAVSPIHFRPVLTNCAGAGIYDDANGDRWVLVADAAAIWLLRDGCAPIPLTLPAGTSISTRCRFLQAASDRIYCLRGPDHLPLEWRGDRAQPWRLCVATIEPDRAEFLQSVPPSSGGAVMADRLFVFVADQVFWSDVLDYSAFDMALNNARFARGESAPITAVASYQGSRLVVFKESATYFLNNVGGDMSSVSVDRLPSEIGCVAQGSVASVGNDLIWLGSGGIYRLSQTEQGVLRGDPLPLSADISGTMARVNWSAAAAATACVTTADGATLYRIALPLDGSAICNAVLVYDVTRGRWVSEDYYGLLPETVREPAAVPDGASAPIWYDPGAVAISYGTTPEQPGFVAAADCVPVTYCGRQTAALVTLTRILILDQPGLRDQMDAAEWPIYTQFATRGYLLESLEHKQIAEVLTAASTQDAALQLTVAADGVGEALDAGPDRLRDRRRYTTWGRPDYVVSNANGDFGAGRREDYTVYLEDAPDYSKTGDGRIHLDLLASWTDSRPIRGRGRWFQVILTADRGRLQIDSIQAVARQPKRARHQQF